MALESPVGPTNSAWTIRADSVDRISGYPVTLMIDAMTDNPDDPRVTPIVQQAVDVLQESGRFVVMTAGRTSTYTESMTPTDA